MTQLALACEKLARQIIARSRLNWEATNGVSSTSSQHPCRPCKELHAGASAHPSSPCFSSRRPTSALQLLHHGTAILRFTPRPKLQHNERGSAVGMLRPDDTHPSSPCFSSRRPTSALQLLHRVTAILRFTPRPKLTAPTVKGKMRRSSGSRCSAWQQEQSLDKRTQPLRCRRASGAYFGM